MPGTPLFCETITVPTANYVFAGIQFQQGNPGEVYAKNVKLFFNAATVGLTEDSWIKKAINDSNAGWTKMPLKTDKSRSMNEATSVFKSHKTIPLVPVLLILLKE